jgi:hypothetical protein
MTVATLRRRGDAATSGLEAVSPPVADYAFLSDCENTCVVASAGTVEWPCLSRPHDRSIFGTILDRSASSFRLSPSDTSVPGQPPVCSGHHGVGDDVRLDPVRFMNGQAVVLGPDAGLVTMAP